MSNSLGNTIALSVDAQALWAQGPSKDADLLVELNRPQRKKINGRGGLVTMAETTDALGTELTAMFNFTIQQVVENLRLSQSPADHAQALYLFDFRERFSKSDLGVDFSNETLRATLTALLTQANWTQEQIAGILALGYTLQSPAQEMLGRPATQADINDYREWTVKEKVKNDYQNGMEPVLVAYESGNRAELVAALRALADGLEA